MSIDKLVTLLNLAAHGLVLLLLALSALAPRM